MTSCIPAGSDETSGRALFVIDAARPDDVPAALPLPSRYFACLLAWDSESASVDAIYALARSLLAAGCAYVCLWGRGCERAHDLFDEADVEVHLEVHSEERFVMSTWHARETLAHALWFSLSCSEPAAYYADGCRSLVCIAIGAPEWAAQMRSAFADPGAFRRRVLASEGGEDV